MAGRSKMTELFVRNIPWTVSSKELSQYMSRFGEVFEARVPFDTTTGKHKGLGWVRFRNDEAVDRCLQTHDHFLDGNFIYVKVSHDGGNGNNDGPQRGSGRNNGNGNRSRGPIKIDNFMAGRNGPRTDNLE